MYKIILVLILFLTSLFSSDEIKVPILCYHRFGNVASDSMTVTNSLFESHLAWLKDNGYTVIPLDTLAKYLRGETEQIPEKSVVITVDDGHKSVYTDMRSIVEKYNIPVTLFIYPSAISNASYAMSWDELRELEKGGLFRIESHTLWHPNFKTEKKKLTPLEYEKFVKNQLAKSKQILEKKMEHEVEYLAWAFGIYDEHLEKEARDAGYKMTFSIDRKHSDIKEEAMPQARYLMVNSDNTKRFEAIITGKATEKSKVQNGY